MAGRQQHQQQPSADWVRDLAADLYARAVVGSGRTPDHAAAEAVRLARAFARAWSDSPQNTEAPPG